MPLNDLFIFVYVECISLFRVQHSTDDSIIAKKIKNPTRLYGQPDRHSIFLNKPASVLPNSVFSTSKDTVLSTFLRR